MDTRPTFARLARLLRREAEALTATKHPDVAWRMRALALVSSLLDLAHLADTTANCSDDEYLKTSCTGPEEDHALQCLKVQIGAAVALRFEAEELHADAQASAARAGMN